MNGRFVRFKGLNALRTSFFRIPKALMRDPDLKKLPGDAKILYGILLDRMDLSLKNKWLDRNGDVYIVYTIEDLMEDLGCGKTKMMGLLSDLEKAGMIERKRQGLGKVNIIYVHDYIPEDAEEDAANLARNMYEDEFFGPLDPDDLTDFDEENNEIPDDYATAQEMGFKKSEIPDFLKPKNCAYRSSRLRTSKSTKNGLIEVRVYERLKAQKLGSLKFAFANIKKFAFADPNQLTNNQEIDRWIDTARAGAHTRIREGELEGRELPPSGLPDQGSVFTEPKAIRCGLTLKEALEEARILVSPFNELYPQLTDPFTNMPLYNAAMYDIVLDALTKMLSAPPDGLRIDKDTLAGKTRLESLLNAEAGVCAPGALNELVKTVIDKMNAYNSGGGNIASPEGYALKTMFRELTRKAAKNDADLRDIYRTVI